MERVRFITHNSRQILHLDFAECRSDEVLAIIETAKGVIRTQAPGSVYTLTDVRETGFNTAVSDAMKEFARHNKPYVAAAAVVGVHGLKRIIFNAVMKFSGRHLSAFDTPDEAKDWLAKQ